MKDRFLDSEGTIGRFAFMLRILLLAVVAALITYYAVDYFSHWHHGTYSPLGPFLGIVTIMFCSLIGLMQLLKRLRDMGKQPYLSILLIVPGLNVLLLLYAAVAPPQEDGHRD
jgi:uncharacterized membrane protein YhaH (DUF805 family)